ncbi:MAG: DNA recombination protein RmuC, partial [Burkholderiaceae bacterium]|nr:DNA recombination protein RmuC [Burkholderiaceae bacterium]
MPDPASIWLLIAVALAAGASALALGLMALLSRRQERLERALRAAVESAASQGRIETGARLAEVQAALSAQLTQTTGVQTQQLAAYGQTLQQHLEAVGRALQSALGDVRATLQTQLASLQADNAAKLETIRATVDEHLHGTLQARLGDSFRLVSERLERVQRALGEMQALAASVGDLKRVLSNVRARGVFGEVRLETLLQ